MASFFEKFGPASQKKKGELEKMKGLELSTADPITSSRVLLPQENLRKGKKTLEGNQIHTDSSKGNFYEITDHKITSKDGYTETIRSHPETQMVVSRILKGFANVASVVPMPNGKYASYEAPKKEAIKKIDSEALAPAEARADILILSDLFFDWDRTITNSTKENGFDSENIRLYKDGTYILFDFADAINFWFRSVEEGTYAPRLPSDPFVLEALLKKVIALKQYYYSDSGIQQFKSIIESSGKTLPDLFPKTRNDSKIDYTLADFHAEFISRLAVMAEAIESNLHADSHNEEA